MRDRVRAILITDDGHLLTIKRIKPGQNPYWVLPGGGIEADDVSLEGALHRELREELAGEADIHALVHILATAGGREHFFLARIQQWNFANRTGPEFAEADRGQYVLQPIPLTNEGIGSITLQPPQIADFLRSCLAQAGDVFALPDLRTATARSL
ncbi:NUDIX domain-containing protein [Nonomuraea sp. M3C6]|uniref:NUDIX domain-containing protein n=1 Tax=Nonomuraea marmarensis TaxID=3351344 RepID=A0ABW7AQC8_9ACTN